MIPGNYLEKVYAGFLGMNAGIRLGAPVEPTMWTYERIQNTYGDITGYVKEYKNFAADDDANGPFYFLRALYDDASDRELTPQDVARAWLNYTREGTGMFWWGGYGRSTEHTAYLNLKMGVPSPQSGSIAQNGKILAEQIGGQIFIDTWGLVIPDDPEKAADYGQIAASVSHDGEGVYGARFFCAAISKAFVCDNIMEVVAAGLAQIPLESEYRRVAQAVLDFHENNPDDFRACRDMLEKNWGYDKYPGVCHIIPNAGVCVLSMLYGTGDFNRTIEIATICGWDTDCNAGNVGTVLGVMNGIGGIAGKYRAPINDSIVLSGISGYLNILDIPTYAKELALLGYRLTGEEPPVSLAESFREGELYFDFELPGSTHNLRISEPYFCSTTHTTERAFKGSGSLKVLFDRFSRGDSCKVFYKPYYTRKDFSDERYSPVFSPTVYSGQRVSMKIYLEQWEGNETMGIAPYVRLSHCQTELVQGYVKLVENEWIDVGFVIPDTQGDLIEEVGIVLEGYSAATKSLGVLYIDEFRINGKAEYRIDFTKQKINFGCVSPFSHNHGAWSVEDGGLHAISCEFSEAYAGNYFSRDYAVVVPVKPLHGAGHLLAIRAQGAKRGYLAGFDKEGLFSLYINNFGLHALAEVPFGWKHGTQYRLELKAVGKRLVIAVDGKELITYDDPTYAYGMYGCVRNGIGRTWYGNFSIREL